MKIDSDPWLKAIFGYPVFRLAVSAEDTAEGLSDQIGAFLSRGQRKDRSFYYTRIPTTRVDCLTTLTSVGFNVVDVAVTFAMPVGAVRHSGELGVPVLIRDARPGDHSILLKIASSCFGYSRFHLDPAIPNDTANAVKRAWVQSYCQSQRGERLLVAERDGQPVGFLAILARGSGNRAKWIIDLLGVDSAHQGCGIGQALVEAFIAAGNVRAQSLQVGTQVANLPSLRLYEKCGFRIIESAYVLHAHVGSC